MKILITGINSHLAKKTAAYHLGQGDTVYGVYHVHKENVPEGVHLIASSSIDQLTDHVFDTVYLIGAFVPRNGYNTPNEAFYETNIRQTHKLCSLFPGARIVFCSSVAVYGNPAGSISENSVYNDPSLYGLSKLAGEMLVKQCASYAILRFSAIYGKELGPNNFINRCAEQANTTGEITLFGDGSRKQNYLYLEDAVKYLTISNNNRNNGVFLCTSAHSYSNLEIAGWICRQIPGAQIKFKGIDHSFSYYYDNSATLELLKGIELTDIEKGINSLFE